MSDSRTLAVLLGAAIVIGALFAPWYAVDLGQTARDAIGSQAQQLPGPFGDFAKQLVTMLPERIEATAWMAFERTDIVLLGAAIAAAFSALLNRLDVAALAGGVVAGATVWAMVDGPGAGELISLEWGAWLALAGGLAIVGASKLGARTLPAADHAPTDPSMPGTSPTQPQLVAERNRSSVPPWG